MGPPKPSLGLASQRRWGRNAGRAKGMTDGPYASLSRSAFFPPGRCAPSRLCARPWPWRNSIPRCSSILIPVQRPREKRARDVGNGAVVSLPSRPVGRGGPWTPARRTDEDRNSRPRGLGDALPPPVGPGVSPGLAPGGLAGRLRGRCRGDSQGLEVQGFLRGCTLKDGPCVARYF